MSKFRTTIPVDLSQVTNALPKGSAVTDVQWNKDAGTVDVLWEHDRFRTPWTFPTEFPLEQLRFGGLPEKTTDLQAAPAPEPAPPPAPPVEKPKRKR